MRDLLAISELAISTVVPTWGSQGIHTIFLNLYYWQWDDRMVCICYRGPRLKIFGISVLELRLNARLGTETNLLIKQLGEHCILVSSYKRGL